MKASQGFRRLLFPCLLALFVLLTYWPVFSSGRLPGGDLSDTVHQGYPFARFVEDAVREGRVPGWNPWVFCGIPFYSSFSAPVFYPPRSLLILAGGFEAMVRFTFPLHMFLGGMFAWLFLGSIGVSRAGRIVGALAFAGGAWANTLFYAGHASKIICWSYLPLLLYACERWMQTRKLPYLALGGLALGMQGLASHPQMILYSGMAAFVWLLFRAVGRDGRPGRAVLCLAVIAVLGAGIAAVQLLPGYEFSGLSTRGADLSPAQAASYSLPPEETLTMFLPDMFGLRHGFRDSSMSGAPVYFGRLGLRLSSEFLGVSVFLLGILGFISGGGRRRWPLLAISLTGLLVSWGGYTPVFRILYALLPVFRKLRAPHMAAFLTTSGIALASGPGFDALTDPSGKRRKYLLLGVFTGLCAVLLLFAGPLSRGLQSGWWSRMGLPGASGFAPLVDHRTGMLEGDLARAAGIGAALLVLLYLSVRYGKRSVLFAAGSLVVLIGLELVPFDRSFQVYLPQTRIDQLYPDDPDLREMAGDGRVIPGGNELVPLSIRSVGGYHAAKPSIVDRMQSLLAAGDFATARMTAVTVFDLDGTHVPYAELRSMLLQQVAGGDSSLADSMALLVPPEPLPKAFFAAGWTTVADGELERSLGTGVSPEELTFLVEGPDGLDNSPATGTATITVDLPELVAVATSCEGAGLLVLADTWHPSWTALVDGSEVPLMRANLWQRAVVVPAGDHTVEFVFHDASVGTGLAVSAASLLLAAAALIPYSRKRRGEP